MFRIFTKNLQFLKCSSRKKKKENVIFSKEKINLPDHVPFRGFGSVGLLMGLADSVLEIGVGRVFLVYLHIGQPSGVHLICREKTRKER